MDESGVDYDARLAALATAFAQSLPGKRAEIEAAWTRWRAGEAAARATLQALTHRLGGSADNYGFEALGAAARALDAALLPRLGAAPAQVAGVVAALLAVFDRPAPAP